MTDEQIIKAWDILAKLDFFGGQRAGRELWNSKPVDVQNEDIENFSKDIAFLKDFINRQDAEVERLKAEAECADGYADALVERTKTEAIKEFAERLKGKYKDYDKNVGAVEVVPLFNAIDNLAKELTE